MVSKEMESRIDKFIAIIDRISSTISLRWSTSRASARPATIRRRRTARAARKVLDKALQMCEQMGFATKNYDYYAGSAAYGSRGEGDRPAWSPRCCSGGRRLEPRPLTI